MAPNLKPITAVGLGRRIPLSTLLSSENPHGIPVGLASKEDFGSLKGGGDESLLQPNHSPVST